MISRGGKYHRSDMSKQDGAVMVGFNKGATFKDVLCLQRETLWSLVLLESNCGSPDERMITAN